MQPPEISRFFRVAPQHGTTLAWCDRFDVYVNVNCQPGRLPRGDRAGDRRWHMPWNAVERALERVDALRAR